jgi:hypothetical protein
VNSAALSKAWSILGAEAGQEGCTCTVVQSFKQRHKQIPTLRGGQKPSEAAGWVPHHTERKKISGIPLCWSSSVNKKPVIFMIITKY